MSPTRVASVTLAPGRRGCPWLSRVEGAVEPRASRWRDLESIVGGQHVFSSAVGLQGFCGVDILRQLRFASHHRPLFPLVMLQLRGDEASLIMTYSHRLPCQHVRLRLF